MSTARRYNHASPDIMRTDWYQIRPTPPMLVLVAWKVRHLRLDCFWIDKLAVRDLKGLRAYLLGPGLEYGFAINRIQGLRHLSRECRRLKAVGRVPGTSLP